MKKLILLLLLTGCATTEKYDAKVKTWVGSDINELIASWGPPSSGFDMPNGNKMYTYVKSMGSSTYVDNDALIGTTARTNSLYCKTTFTVAGSRITDYHWQGNRCISD
jgi:hypothetical protein